MEGYLAIDPDHEHDNLDSGVIFTGWACGQERGIYPAGPSKLPTAWNSA